MIRSATHQVYIYVCGAVWCWTAAMGMLLMLMLYGCGGGGVGSGGTGIAQGTVSGFGSVIVDGVEFADASASVQAEDGAGTQQNANVRLGQQVRVLYSGANVAQRIVVMAQLAGPVSATPDANGWLRVMNQWVRLVTSESDASRSSLTVLGGYADTTAIVEGDDVEIHGSWVFDSTRSAYVLVATRLEKLTVAADPVQLSGVVNGLGTSTFRLNSATGTQIQAAALPAALANGQIARVWVARAAMANSPVVASRVTAQTLAAQDIAGQSAVRVSGLAANYDPATRTVEVQGMRIRIEAAAQVDEAALERGEFVSLQVARNGDTLVASSARLRGTATTVDLGATTEVKGVTSGVDWSAATVTFTLRATPIRAVAAVIDASCRSIAASADVFVEVKGKVLAPGAPVTATRVQCSLSLPGDSTVERHGLVKSVNLASSTLVITTLKGDVSASWDSTTYFEKRPETLPGRLVEVEGIATTGTASLRLRKLTLDD